MGPDGTHWCEFWTPNFHRVISNLIEETEPPEWIPSCQSSQGALFVLQSMRNGYYICPDGVVRRISESAGKPVTWLQTTRPEDDVIIGPLDTLTMLNYGLHDHPHMEQLKELLPVRPADRVNCPHCVDGWLLPDRVDHLACPACGGLGWATPKAWEWRVEIPADRYPRDLRKSVEEFIKP